MCIFFCTRITGLHIKCGKVIKQNRVLRVIHAGDSFGEMLCFGFQFRCQVAAAAC